MGLNAVRLTCVASLLRSLFAFISYNVSFWLSVFMSVHCTYSSSRGKKSRCLVFNLWFDFEYIGRSNGIFQTAKPAVTILGTANIVWAMNGGRFGYANYNDSLWSPGKLKIWETFYIIKTQIGNTFLVYTTSWFAPEISMIRGNSTFGWNSTKSSWMSEWMHANQDAQYKIYFPEKYILQPMRSRWSKSSYISNSRKERYESTEITRSNSLWTVFYRSSRTS